MRKLCAKPWFQHINNLFHWIHYLVNQFTQIRFFFELQSTGNTGKCWQLSEGKGKSGRLWSCLLKLDSYIVSFRFVLTAVNNIAPDKPSSKVVQVISILVTNLRIPQIQYSSLMNTMYDISAICTMLSVCHCSNSLSDHLKYLAGSVSHHCCNSNPGTLCYAGYA